MKKLLFLLLLPFMAMAQVSTGQEQGFDYGIKNNSSQKILTPDTLVTKGADGTYGHTSAYRLPVSTATQAAIDVKIASNAGLQNAYNFEPEIVTSAIKGAVAIRRGSAADTDNVLVVQNGAGSDTFTVKGNGDITGGLYNSYTPANDVNVVHLTGNENKTGALGVTALNTSVINTIRNELDANSRIWRFRNDVDVSGNYSFDVGDTNSETPNFLRVVRLNKDQTVNFFGEAKGLDGESSDAFVTKAQLDLSTSQDFIFYGNDYKDTHVLIEDASMYIYILSDIPVYQISTNKTFTLKMGAYLIPNNSVFYLKELAGGKITDATANGSDISIGSVLISAFNTGVSFNSVGVLKDLKINTNYSLFKNYDVSDLKNITSNNYSAVSEIKKEIKPFWEQVNSLTNSDLPLNIIAIGDSISNFQELGSENEKTDHTKEPQGLYGNTFLRQIWKTFNAIGEDGTDPENDNFAAFSQAAQGNIHYVRLDNAAVTTNTDFIPHGTRVSDGKKIYWSLRQNINGMTTSLGGYRNPTPDAGTKYTSIGDIALHNHTYFFAGNTSFFRTDVPSETTGFSLVFWGDAPTASFPQIEGGADEFLSNSVGIFVDNILVQTIDPTTFRGQSRVDIQLTPSVGTTKEVKIYNLGTGLVAYWGIEYWTGKAVRVLNYAMAGNPAQSFSDNADYTIDHNADMYVWQLTSLNNVGGDSQIVEHVELGNLLKNKNVPILATTCHPVVEGLGGTTNYPDGVGTYSHPDYFATLKALYELEIPFSDTFSAFNKMGLETNYTNYYSKLFIDGGHLSSLGQDIYKKLLIESVAFTNSDNNSFGYVSYAPLLSPTFTGTPTAPTATAGTNTTQIATTAFVQNVARPYKVYTALLTQTGTNAPVATVLENTLGGTVTWSRTVPGGYFATLSDAFTTDKTTVLITNGSTNGNYIHGAAVSTTNVNIIAPNDGQIDRATVEIRVYN